MKTADKKPASPPEKEPDGNAFERMKELTRRIVNVPKAEVAKPKPKK